MLKDQLDSGAIDDKTKAYGIQVMTESVKTDSIGKMIHDVLEGARNRIIEFLGNNIPNWLRTVPVCYSYTGEPDACVINGTNNHPIIILDYAFIVGLERATKLFMLSWDISKPDLRELLLGLELCRQEFWAGSINDPPLQPKVTGQDSLQATYLMFFMLHFIIAHELSHIVLGHLSSNSMYSINISDKKIDLYHKTRSQEKEAICLQYFSISAFLKNILEFQDL